MKVTYIDHSCFVIEFESVVFIFDYFRGTLPTFDSEKEIYFFASHKHHDHFDLKIFEYSKQYEKVKYVLSKDISLGENYLIRNNIDPSIKEKIIRIGKDCTMDILAAGKPLRIETLRSTDAGVAFMLSYEGKSIYHAGDLNWWSWKGETEKEDKKMTDAFVCEMAKIEGRHFDVAFVVLDPRQEERYWWGFDYFMRITNTDVVFPMHCWGDYSIINQFMENNKSQMYRERIKNIQYEGQQYII